MHCPLSEEMRPSSLQDLVGQEHLLTEHSLLLSLFRAKRPLSLLLWGPPGCGKTTLMHLYLRKFPGNHLFFHPALHTLQQIKAWLGELEQTPLFAKSPLLAVDEIHRMTKVQQDALLPYLEKGLFTLVGATTENPSFSLQKALLSRIRVLTLHPLNEQALLQILERALDHKHLTLSLDCKQALLMACQGDARHLLNSVEDLLTHPSPSQLSLEELSSFLSKKCPLYDCNDELHHALISVWHKAIRGSDCDAALYWLARMLDAGEDPHYIARRLVRIAIEDIGLAEPKAQEMALHAWQVYERLGSPEGDLAFAEATVFLALSPKSNAIYEGFNKAKQLAKETSHLFPKSSFIEAPNTFMKDMGFGKGYLYDHDMPSGCAGQDFFPNNLPRHVLYYPKERGFERDLRKRIDFFQKQREKT